MRVLGSCFVVGLLFLTVGARPGHAQSDGLSLQDALRLTRVRNGTVRAALSELGGARSRVRQSISPFWPQVSPVYQYNTSRTIFDDPLPGLSSRNQTNENFEFQANWRLLDSGERWTSLGISRSGARASEYSALQTLRTVLFNVHRQFYDALRAQELMRVQEAQLERAQKIHDQTRARVEAGDLPRKDILQAQADLLNARANALFARNRVTNTQADLKATIGWDPAEPLPPLQAVQDSQPKGLELSLDQALNQGLQQRPDLRAQRQSVESRRLAMRLAQIDQGVKLSLDANYIRGVRPDAFGTTGLTVRATIPLFDGFRSAERVRESRFSLESETFRLVQQERLARSEIEAAYKELAQNRERLEAARAAREAAQINYQAALESQRLGAATLIEVLTAQVSLVTAESNYVEAVYDTLISEVRFRLAMGEPIPGEA